MMDNVNTSQNEHFDFSSAIVQLIQELDITGEAKNLWQVLEPLSNLDFQSLKNNEKFITVMRHLDIDKISYPSELPSPNQLISDVHFNNQYDKLILRISNSFHNAGVPLGEHLKDILVLTENDLNKMHGIGVRYITMHQELRTLYQTKKLFNSESEKVILEHNVDNLNAESFRLNNLCLTNAEEKILEKLTRSFGEIQLKELIQLKRSDFLTLPGFGQTFIDTLVGVQQRILNELIKVANNKVNPSQFQSDILLPAEPPLIAIEELDKYLLEDIDDFLSKRSEQEQKIFQCRLGFVEPHLTLEELGTHMQITRERVRQIERDILQFFIRKLRISQEVIWTILQSNIDHSLPKRMPYLSSCFDNNIHFFEFIDLLCGGKNILQKINPNIKNDFLDDFFAHHGVPCEFNELEDQINDTIEMQQLECSSLNIIDFLLSCNKIRIASDSKIYPMALSKNQAAAAVLVHHPSGLPWRDISKLVNNSGISSTNLQTDRLDRGAFYDSELTYVSGVGIYRHSMFINIQSLDFDAIFSEVLKYGTDIGTSAFHLQALYQYSKYLQAIDYHIIRYIIKMYGEDYGVWFNGRSQTDSVSLEPNVKRITQTDVILQAMRDKKNPITRSDIAQLIKSKSLYHASVYLDNLMNANKVVQVEKSYYTIPEIAWNNLPIAEIVYEIDMLLYSENRPVEVSVIQYYLNAHFNYNFSRYFYSSIARYYSKEKSWYRSRTFYCINPIEFNGIFDAFNYYCNPKSDIDKNIQNLCENVAVTSEIANLYFRQWSKNTKVT